MKCLKPSTPLKCRAMVFVCKYLCEENTTEADFDAGALI